jgi:uncharacterized protein YlaI
VNCKKAAYRDKDVALDVMHSIAGKKDGRKKPVRVYQCDDCGKWHLTSKAIGEMVKIGFTLTQDWTKLIE